MFKKMLLAALLLGTVTTVTLTGCYGRGPAYVRAGYYGEYPYRRGVPYYDYDPFYDPFFYPYSAYIYGPYPYYFYGDLFYGYPYYPYYFYPHHHRFIQPGERSLHGFRDGSVERPAPTPAPTPAPESDRSLHGERNLR